MSLCRRHPRLRLRTDDIADNPAEQARQALRNIAATLAEAGASLGDVVRVRYYLPDMADWPAVVPVLGEVFGNDPAGGDGAHLRSRRSAHED